MDIKFDLNKINREYYYGWIDRVGEAKTRDELWNLTGEMLEKVCTDWPFGDVTTEVYKGLGVVDAKEVDDALTDAMADVNKKKSEKPSI